MNLIRNYRNWRVYRETVTELGRLSNRQLHDLGIVRDESRADYERIMRSLVDRGAQGIILGCTEIELLIQQNDSSIPLFPTSAIHAIAAVEKALEGI
jgi:aspartate/glutamate racemase